MSVQPCASCGGRGGNGANCCPRCEGSGAEPEPRKLGRPILGAEKVQRVSVSLWPAQLERLGEIQRRQRLASLSAALRSELDRLSALDRERSS